MNLTQQAVEVTKRLEQQFDFSFTPEQRASAVKDLVELAETYRTGKPHAWIVVKRPASGTLYLHCNNCGLITPDIDLDQPFTAPELMGCPGSISERIDAEIKAAGG